MSMGPEQVTARRGGGSEGLVLSVGLTPNLRTRPILDGMFHADGVTMNPLELHPSELFWRQLKFAEFDIAEMSMSSLLMATARGDDRFVGLPVFSTHYFFQNWIMIRKDSGIKKPEDLAGPRISPASFPPWPRRFAQLHHVSVDVHASSLRLSFVPLTAGHA